MREYDRCFVKWWVLNCRVELLFLVELSCRFLSYRTSPPCWTVILDCRVELSYSAEPSCPCQTVLPNCRDKLSCQIVVLSIELTDIALRDAKLLGIELADRAGIELPMPSR